MNTQIGNFPATLLVGATICFAPEIYRDVAVTNANYSQSGIAENSNVTNMEGLLLPSPDITTMEEINVVESSDENAEQSALEKKFKELSQKWKAETGGYSSVGSIVMHPAYLEIISHGEAMIPFILKDLQKKPSHWFIALKTLAKNYSPVKPEDAGNIKKMTEAWLAWGKANGKLS